MEHIKFTKENMNHGSLKIEYAKILKQLTFLFDKQNTVMIYFCL
jgi:hypothetical protein